jgi:aspartyl-tRNA(Asn)/glutamyl-tRNA(Gln) amidotransferase subunit C
MNNIALRLRDDAATEANRREDYQAPRPRPRTACTWCRK